MIYCYDKVTGKSFHADIKDIAHENLFYDIAELPPGTIERNLAKKDELFNIGYSQLLQTRDVKKLAYYPSKFLFLFIITQYLRTSEVRDDIQSISDQAMNRLAEKMGIKIPTDYKLHTNPESVRRIHLNMILDRDSIITTADKLSQQEWVVSENETGMNLWTSDHPVTIDNTYNGELGLLSKGREIHLPLTPKLCLASFDPITHQSPVHNNIEYVNLLYNNILQVRRSMRYIFSADNDFSLARLFLKDYPSFKDHHLRRTRVL